MPITTVTARVRIAASSKRGNHQQDVAQPAQHQREQQRDRGDCDDPGLTKAELISRPASRIVTGVPVASGATARTAATNRSSTTGSRALPLGKTSTRARPSAAIQLSRNSAGRLARVDRLCLDLFGRAPRGGCSRPVSRTCRNAGTIAAPRAAAWSSAPARRAAGLRGPPRAARGRSASRQAAIARNDVSIARRRQDSARGQRRPEQQREIADDRQLLVLIVGDKARRGDRLRDFRQLAKPVGDRLGLASARQRGSRPV